LPLPFESRFCTAPDGLKLHIRDYGSALDPGLAVVCLAGLTRNSADFDPLANALASGARGPKRRVLAPDYRGRGGSDNDPDWRHYSLAVEHADLLSILTAFEISAAVFIGTSRGGLHTMMLSGTRPSVLRGAVLNDIGPVIEPAGFARIRGYVGRLPVPRSIPDGVDLLKGLMSERFTSLSEADWEAYAKTTFTDAVGRLGPRYDQMLMRTLEDLDLEQPLPDLWRQYDGLDGMPLLILRGANSDLLSSETLEQMLRRHRGAEALTIEGQGHAPLLLDKPTIDRICDFIARIDSSEAFIPSRPGR